MTNAEFEAVIAFTLGIGLGLILLRGFRGRWGLLIALTLPLSTAQANQEVPRAVLQYQNGSPLSGGSGIAWGFVPLARFWYATAFFRVDVPMVNYGDYWLGRVTLYQSYGDYTGGTELSRNVWVYVDWAVGGPVRCMVFYSGAAGWDTIPPTWDAGGSSAGAYGLRFGGAATGGALPLTVLDYDESGYGAVWLVDMTFAGRGVTTQPTTQPTTAPTSITLPGITELDENRWLNQGQDFIRGAYEEGQGQQPGVYEQLRDLERQGESGDPGLPGTSTIRGFAQEIRHRLLTTDVAPTPAAAIVSAMQELSANAWTQTQGTGNFAGAAAGIWNTLVHPSQGILIRIVNTLEDLRDPNGIGPVNLATFFSIIKQIATFAFIGWALWAMFRWMSWSLSIPTGGE